MPDIVTKEMLNPSAPADPACTDVNITGSKATIAVTVNDIHMPFMSMVTFMVKWAIAAIPAIIILVVFFAMLSAFFGGLFMR